MKSILIGFLLVAVSNLYAAKSVPKGAITVHVLGFMNGPVHRQDRSNSCVLFVQKDFGSKMGLVIDAATCKNRKEEFEYLVKVTKNVTILRSSYSKITDANELEKYFEIDADAYYVKLNASAKFTAAGPAIAKVVNVEESLSPEYSGKDGVEYVFGQNLVCVVYLNIPEDGNDLVGVVLDQSRCSKEKLAGLKGKDVYFSRQDLEYLHSNKMIAALKTINRDYFYKAMRDNSTGFKIK